MGDTPVADEFDVVIAGGGLVGGSLAIALAQIKAQTNCRVALIESVPPESDAQPSFDDRTIALSRGSYRILRQLGIWSHIQVSVWPIQKIHVSQQQHFGTSVIDAIEQGVAELGYVINSRVLGEALWEQIRALPDVTVFCPTSVTATEIDREYEDGRCRVELQGADGTQSITTRLLVAADGARSQVRTALGISAEDRDYKQVAVVAKVQIDAEYVGHVAYERFTKEGPLAMLPGPDGQYTVVLARNVETVQSVMDMSDEALLTLLQSLFGFRLGRLRRLGKRQAYPLHLVTAGEIMAERSVIIGNAANGLHPVAAQGFNLGLRDVASLAEIIADGLRNDMPGQGQKFDPGAKETLQAYADWRQRDQRRVVKFTDGLIRLFGVQGGAAAAARGLSLAAFDVLPGAKKELARQTMGLAGKMSRLARGLPL
ncbi:MAG: 2-octaprenyl-6-methoxyphenyl hydroxylase [Gammaproteobacteria bacterium]|nr:2-octaprenyl-6-methoxyphenyl hydroxylase [Gammaproteobacteria bacterium]MCP4276773.1 2-octaprenyl-6-methoxyphenyl hydroxylase [Gammaproteobacteria bacterium]MCP4830616.1 2-octaprenyl-6-methoxyphenyl hydroxylase [Gammaproteobacteria bacterium]MCP4928425.1 2-octaprenyl-6-methoxyphenyl hydroxylase [Gammaproteobacteria bacterium]